MKALIATVAGVLVLGGVLVATSVRTTSAQAAPQSVQTASTPADRPTLINCGEGRQAVLYPNRGNGVSQLECVAQDPYARPFPTIDNGAPTMGYALQPVSQYTTAPVVQERVVYRDRPVSTSRRSVRSSSPTYRRASTSEPARRSTRSWKKSAVIIGGSTAGGAGVGALLGGSGGAKKGAVAGLLGGTIYDIATRNKH